MGNTIMPPSQMPGRETTTGFLAGTKGTTPLFFKIVASGREPAYRGARPIAFVFNPFEARRI